MKTNKQWNWQKVLQNEKQMFAINSAGDYT